MRYDLVGRGALEDRIYKAMVEGESTVRQRYRRLIDPYSRFTDRHWPASQIGMLPRMSADYYDTRLRYGDIADLVRDDVPETRMLDFEDLRWLLKKVCLRMGGRSFSPEWRDGESQQQLFDKIEASTNITVMMNLLLAELAERHMIRVFDDVVREKTLPTRRDQYRHMDFGCGMFGTTITGQLSKMHQLSLLGLIPRDYNDYLHIILIDVDPNATYQTQQILSNPHMYRLDFRPPRQVDTVNINFLDLDRSSQLRRYEGQVDTFTEGAAFCHVPDLAQTFDFVHFLSSHRSATFFWDWLAKTFAADYLLLPRRGEKGGYFMFEIEGEEPVFVSSPDRLPQGLHERLKGNRWHSKYVMKEDDVKPHHANMYAWQCYWGFMRWDPRSGEIMQKEVDGMPIWDYYHALFDRLAGSDRGFSPINDWVIGTLARYRKRGLVPFGTDRVRYNFIESYGPEYAEKMRGSGFTSVDIPFDRLLMTINSLNGVKTSVDSAVDQLNETQKETRHALRVTVGCRDGFYFDELFGSLGNGR
ncbi:hypothetical protein JW898_00430 [Candidatus Woesearchaeota archaeon]|nr:hypothetical protein [Candidatus Woesearchaeota archaeon]